ncbi:DUF2298 domain-containing protein [Halobacillus sp. Nhm2S1]|uniref:DUF2298 domain-containing protein n=1 Tax=Halobacillus sp. Nhm2S1 TaxID=2866716 RepID=UPI001C73CF58|nr:DUF2298 domain-containing protein [Halobacillus sp. Nhm2S1]MBX0356936.1 DUF2298 domain-containing protein [Halobacillus sp. Nhm2S1]
MLANIMWGLFLVLFIAFMIFLDRKKTKKRRGQPPVRKTEQEKEVERAVAREKGFRGGPGGGDGM